MKIRMWLALSAAVLLAGCAASSTGYVAEATPPAPTAAPPQRVDAVSNVLAARMADMLASQHLTGNTLMR